MQRFTISLDDMLAAQFDALITPRGYSNRSAVAHDLLLTQTDQAHLPAAAALWCVETINYAYNHQDTVVAQRVLSLQHIAPRSGDHESAHSPGAIPMP
jgi:CopG family nickel-responsive transcriptional regulator